MMNLAAMMMVFAAVAFVEPVGAVQVFAFQKPRARVVKREAQKMIADPVIHGVAQNRGQ